MKTKQPHPQRTDSLNIVARDGSGSFNAYLALPPSGKGPGIVIAQEIFGVNDRIRALADQFAAEGYVVLVPDLFWRMEPGIQLGYTPEDWQRAFSLSAQFDIHKGLEDIQSALSALRAMPESTGEAGVVGFCLGGKMAYLSASRTDADVAVAYYGVGIEGFLEDANLAQCDVVLHIAGNDKYCPPEAQHKIINALGHRDGFEIFVYDGIDHAFARPHGEHYNEAAAALAKQRTLAALSRTIGHTAGHG